MSTGLMHSTLRIVSISEGAAPGSKTPAGKSILRKFCRCLEQAGYPAVGQFLGAPSGTPGEALTLLGELSEPADLLLINFGPAVQIGEYRRNVEQIITTAKRLNPDVWIVLWGSPPVEDAKRNAQLLHYNAELHDIANYEGVSYFPTQPVFENLTANVAKGDKTKLNEMATAGIATGIAHAYLSELQHTLA